jgi:hypothetical protein
MHERLRAVWLGAILFIAFIAPPTRAALLINEIDYDQPGTDRAEFVELFNSGPATLNLDGYRLELINGSTASPYRSVNLDGWQVSAKGFFVVCGNPDQVLNCNLDAGRSTNLIQNGAPDAVALLTGTTVIDALSYEGTVAGYGEGSGAGLSDSPSLDFVGLSRLPDGFDTGRNNVDFSRRCVTPGLPNAAAHMSCDAPQPAAADPVPLPEPGSTTLLAAGFAALLGFNEFDRRRGRRCTAA